TSSETNCVTSKKGACGGRRGEESLGRKAEAAFTAVAVRISQTTRAKRRRGIRCSSAKQDITIDSEKTCQDGTRHPSARLFPSPQSSQRDSRQRFEEHRCLRI